MLAALLILLVGVPLGSDFPVLSGPLLRGLLFSCLLLVGLWSLRSSDLVFRTGMAIAVVGIVMNVIGIRSNSAVFIYGSFAATFAFLALAVVSTLRQVVAGTEVSANRLVGAVCVYLLLGILWAIAYTVLDRLTEGSFRGSASVEALGWDAEWLYFSFVTMTTLGYGDISPLSATARMLAYVQAVFGQFYIAVLVAGLVSAYISNRAAASPSDETGN